LDQFLLVHLLHNHRAKFYVSSVLLLPFTYPNYKCGYSHRSARLKLS
jgi:hypothetical protein